MAKVYISDHHFGHTNIIEYCARPFRNADEMNHRMMQELLAVVGAGHQLVHGGDVCFGRGKEQWVLAMRDLPGRDQHLLVVGNHDHGLAATKLRYCFERWFGTIVGTRELWRQNHVVLQDTLLGKPVRVLVSHQPQQDLQGCDLNCYGHVHNSLLPARAADRADYLARTGRAEHENSWAARSVTHLNICAEVLDYRPRPLDEVLAMNRAAHATP